ncbi:unnamed protein product [Enterobius vermicularis]|uniref:DNA topoisomerase (ATP-hydrolyzing) n=1 Tax=Enterobius vermicularis TaxID=51028 RepID=A0A0N4VAG5_ENTVE|nr:unnamed protein product [Enterobius vermicularis]
MVDKPFIFRHTDDEEVFSIQLNKRNVHGFTFVTRALSQIYSLLISETLATKRDLFYEQKDLYGVQRNLDQSIPKICRLLHADRISNNVLAAGRGVLMGDLKLKDNDSVLDCSLAPVLINHVSKNAFLNCEARFVLVVEKDAIFQKLVQEGFFPLFSPAVLVTARGYPDLATRQLLKLLSNLYHIPIYGLMDSDPHGIEIALTYKYGSRKRQYDIGDCSLPNFQWVGLSRTEISRYPVPDDKFLYINEQEDKKILTLCRRVANVKEWILLRELKCLMNSGTKLELEAVSGISRGFLLHTVLCEKLSTFVNKEK